MAVNPPVKNTEVAEKPVTQEARAATSDSNEKIAAAFPYGETVSARKENWEPAVLELRSEIDELRRQISQQSGEQTREDGIYAPTFGDVYCPECGLKLEGVSATGPKPQTYSHSFGTSMRLGGVQCKYKGKRFQPSRIFLQFV